MTYALAVVLGAVAGVLAGLFGVGGGILFVPTLTWLGLTQIHAEATSLGRPVTHATSPYRSTSRPSTLRVSAGTRASSGRATIGASTPSMSRKSAAFCGSDAMRARASTAVQ